MVSNLRLMWTYATCVMVKFRVLQEQCRGHSHLNAGQIKDARFVSSRGSKKSVCSPDSQ